MECSHAGMADQFAASGRELDREAPLVEEPYGYGVPAEQIDLAATSGRDLWSSGK